jgi:cytochrome c-type biogenesis protein CcmH/NrfF
MKPLRSPKGRLVGSRSRRLLRVVALLLTASIAVLLSLQSLSPALGQGMNHTGADRTGLIEVKGDLERQAFANLACCCGGCPHEAILTCPCAVADRYRAEVRAMIADGLSLEQIKAEWRTRYGADALTVPPNTGANRILYVAPLVIIIGAAGLVIFALRHFRRREVENSRVVAAGGVPLARADDDEYDKKLDDELKQLDNEE